MSTSTDRHIHFEPQKPTGLVEIVKKTVTGYDQRDQETFYKTDRVGVYSSRTAALEAILKMHPELEIQPLQIDG
jgi:hypothetical protein